MINNRGNSTQNKNYTFCEYNTQGNICDSSIFTIDISGIFFLGDTLWSSSNPEKIFQNQQL